MNHEIRTAEHSHASDPMAKLIRAAGRRQAPPTEHYDAVRRASFEAWQQTLGHRRSRQRYRLAIAASIVVLAVSGLLISTMLPRPSEQAATLTLSAGSTEVLRADQAWVSLGSPGAPLFVGDRVRVDAGAAFELSDGTSLRIMAGTTFAIAAARQLELNSGTLYVDSGELPDEQPVAIITQWARVTDIGTQFEVSTSATGLRIRVRSGLVIVTDDGLAESISGSAGDEIGITGFGPNSRVSRGSIAVDSDSWAWVQRLAIAPQATPGYIRSYLTWISRETGRALEFDSRGTEIQAELQTFSGDTAGLQPLELLSIIAATSNFSYELEPDGTILISRTR